MINYNNDEVNSINVERLSNYLLIKNIFCYIFSAKNSKGIEVTSLVYVSRKGDKYFLKEKVENSINEFEFTTVEKLGEKINAHLFKGKFIHMNKRCKIIFN